MDLLLDLVRKAGFEPRRKAATHGGEYTTPCPKCGGNDRFLIWPRKQSKNCEGAYWCRVCEKGGDAVQFCVDFLNMSYKEAFEACGSEQRQTPSFGFRTLSNPIEKDLNANPTWQSAITTLCLKSHKALLEREQSLDYLNKRGLPLDAVKIYKIGYLAHTVYYNKLSLGLEDCGSTSVWLPKGLTIPTMEKDKVIRLKIRQPQHLPKYVAVIGSLSGLNILKGNSAETVIVVESELDAYAIHHLVKDKATVIAVGSNTKHPDSMSHAILKACKKLVVICDNDKGGEVMKAKWKGLYSKAIICTTPLGKDVGEAFGMGYDVQSWLESIA